MPFQKGHTPWNKEKHLSKEHIFKMVNNRIYKRGKDHPQWKGGDIEIANRARENRHRKGESKRYIEKYGGINISGTKEYIKLHHQKRKAQMRKGGKLPIKRIQLVYEDNIKKYGTLTCYLCELPIIFGKDRLEHKIPLVRGGTNEYENLAISCQSCNNKKYTKTETEYRKEMAK